MPAGGCRAWVLAGCSVLPALAAVAAPGPGLPLPAGEPEADAIARQVYFVNHLYAFEQIAFGGERREPLLILDRDATGQVSVTRAERFATHRFPDPAIKTRDLVVFRSGKLRGTGILATDYREPARSMSLSIWFPALRKIRRMAEPAPEDRWGGSILTYGDIYLRRPRDERHVLLGTEAFAGCLEAMDGEGVPGRARTALPEPACHVQGRSVYRLRSEPVGSEQWYEHRETLVDAVSFADYRSDYFRGGVPIKRIDKDWRHSGQGDPRAQIWRYWYARLGQGGEETIAVAPEDGVAIDPGLDPRLWSERTLRRLKR